ncbi:MAG TPA: glutamate synthase subunit alpha, partial [Ktedonobacterales bacterium]|nr:glutamate synthase subunit alpha [Ktedonobacterales bacterium]
MHVHRSTENPYPLYDPRWEHDACGIGFVAQIAGEASHTLIETALEALTRLTHRGAQDADAETSDGAGLLTQIPQALFAAELKQKGITLARPDDLAVGMIFLPAQEREPEAYASSRQIIEQALGELDLSLLCWRDPPIDYGVLGRRARATAPTIEQILLARPQNMAAKQFERSLYHARRVIEHRLQEAGIADCYIASLSSSVIVYKGLLAPAQLASFYRDLADPRYESAFAVFHQRYSTNTLPSWPLAQPMRMLAHNGEINTIQGNRQWMTAREKTLFSPHWGSKLPDLQPVIGAGSDSAQLDNALEL